ncbi:GNAT family N-acetyltransferase [Confluentibacter citreus]|uniref:GNAT family N-acetyltransferase n=1 Tax=Confluentibacter citreus TaxID=2007307 RepID=UPI000C29363B|nr:GNAT family N-acetyltransferase [Confluentibacter citreus]
MTLVVNKILNESDFESYLKIVESFDVINPFYKILGSNLNDVINDKLRYFTFLSDSEEVLILMPFILRKVPYKDQSETYFDVISPYGYSGPLFNEDMSRGYLIEFWDEVDAWYKQNNVISEFIRFSLDHNHQFYSGVLVPTLINVKGELIEKEAQWNNFKSKVRNNYRKSVSNNLIAKFVSKDITNYEIETFYDIYIKTMSRIGADTDYFYDIDYFKNIIKLSKENFLIAFVFKDDVAISTELILISGNTLYSYLGGTLADYFDLRPNDFLKIEVMKWARANNYKYYLLGGGRVDYDSLYHYKKSFFPNDNDIIYYTGRKIVNKKIYKRLVKIMNANIILDDSNIEIKQEKIKFFPAYRIRNKQ